MRSPDVEQIRKLLAQHATTLPWSVRGDRVIVELGDSGRSQEVRIDYLEGQIRFRSTVLPAKEVTRQLRRWRDLARHSWRRNARKQLVCFTFDDDHALIGQILQPAGSLDSQELVLYVNSLAQECDEYEYRLSGDDRF